MEEQLDDIADGGDDWKSMLREFYSPFENRLTHARDNMPEMKQQEYVGRACPVCGGDLVVKYGRFGKFIGCANHPTCTHTEPYVEFTGIACPVCGETDGGQLVERKSRKGRTFYGCSRYPECQYTAWKLPKNGRETDDEDTDEEGEAVRDIAG
jgi:DNA topoisomerase I